MALKKLTPEIEAKYANTGWLLWCGLPDDGYYIGNRLRVHEAADDVYLDLFGRLRTRPWKPGDGRPAYDTPEGMRPWTRRDIGEGTTDGYFFVDKRIEPINEPYFSLSDILFLAPSHWSPTMKNRYPGAIPTSGFLPARF